MRNADKAPLLSNYLTHEEMVVLADSLDKATTGYRECDRLPFQLRDDTVSPDEHRTFEQLTPRERIAFLANLHGQLLVEIEKQRGNP